MAPAETSWVSVSDGLDRSIIKELFASVSLANLCFLNVWIELSNREHDYYRKLAPNNMMIAAVTSIVILGGLGIWMCMAGARRTRIRWKKALSYLPISVAVVLALNVVRTSVNIPSAIKLELNNNWVAMGILLIFATAILWLAIRKEQFLSRVLTAGLLILFPLFPILVGQALWTQAHRSSQDFADRTSQRSVPATRTRLIWMIFDEWDYRLTFSDRPDGLVLPAVDRLIGETFSATHAVGGGYGTVNAVPSMLMGRRAINSHTSGPNELMVKFDNSSAHVGWSAQPSLFSRMRDAGWTTSATGWYHPYCRVLGPQIDRCSWQPGASIYDRVEYLRPLTFSETVNVILQRQVLKAPMVNRFDIAPRDLDKRQLQLAEFTQIREAAISSLGKTDFIFVHWPVPHPYGIYDRIHGVARTDRRQTYLDNLALVDKTLSEFRSLLEDRNEWDGATLILSSDHSLRIGEWNQPRLWSAEEARATGKTRSPYVPFLVKLPGATKPITYDQPFSILLIHDLILAIARGELAAPDSLPAWFNANSSRFPAPAGS